MLNQRSLKIISVNVNLMPEGLLSFLTSGNTVTRARQLAQRLADNHDADVISVQELYHNDAREAFTRILTETGYEVVNGPLSGMHGGVYYKYHSGQAVYINKKKVTNYQSSMVSFPKEGVHGAGPLEKHVPKGAIWLRLQINENFMLDTYHVHLQSCPFAWVYLFSPRNIRRLQVQKLKEFCQSIQHINSAQMERSQLYIGDFNIEYDWEEFADVQKALNATPVNKKKCVTIGNIDNTSHSPLIWYVGGTFYGHYDAQIDHCLVSPTFPKDFNINLGVFSLTSDDGRSLTDHEGVCVNITSHL